MNNRYPPHHAAMAWPKSMGPLARFSKTRDASKIK
jgi:hypothetical protein